ncbi:N,N-dimethylformamidase beta subunit family domain-containing protein [Methylocapsa sp. S129]|uniref:N,N-dimethylformamidase beta subunit family domain-containing protein n=1 Tax=Methylocapsa sp. S129 TaxID=1641869 RepID=UPI00131D4C52|nr:N,N-dimethylformamidase beta subunit family domain-containing protein [Methylocapsa sp. S129]
MTDTTAVLGYAWPLIVSPGEPIAFHLSSKTLDGAEATLVRVRCADPDPNGPGLKLTELDCAINGPVALANQPIYPGSCAIIPDSPTLAKLGAFTVGAFLWPTLPGARPQTILSRWREDIKAGWRLGLDADGCLEFVLAAKGQSWRVASRLPLLTREWVLAGGAYDPATGRISVMVRSLDPQAGRDRSVVVEGEGPTSLSWPMDTPLVIAARAKDAGDAALCEAFYDGKIDRPRVYAAALSIDGLHRLCEAATPAAADPLLIAAWDFSQDIPTDQVRDLSAHRLHGVLRQMPTRAMTGVNWNGSSERWTEAPSQYGAIHFHSDDMADAGWAPTLHLTTPSAWRSGFYALRLRARQGNADPVESFVAFFVRAELGKPQSRLAFVASTGTFLAYANSALRLDQVHAEAMLEGLLTLSHDDLYLQEHRELGLSTYDTHNDGSGWSISTARRPILNTRPRGNVFNYGNDTHLLDWLEELGQSYDIITDDDIHRHGVQTLAPYACVITGSHPEYISREIWDAFDAYQQGGGRHMYLGGNGFYWRIAYHPTLPHTIEMRRGMSGLRTWEGEAGETALAFTGEPSCTWRSNGRPPQRLLGVGFDGQVFTESSFYRWLDGARDPSVAWLTEGVDLDAPLGDFGLRGNGAAGIEIDRVEPTLGSPPGLVWLATADRLGYGGTPTPEELRTLHRGIMGDQNAQVRADLAFFPTANGGAVFSTGSIAWVCALSHAGYRNNVSQVTGNVLRRFLDSTPL